MSVSVISVYRIGYQNRLILLLNIGYRNNRLIWISVQHKLVVLMFFHLLLSSNILSLNL